MNLLNYNTLYTTGYKGHILRDAPERMLQFGEGNFLRAFVDYFVDVLNEKSDFNSKIVLIQPIAYGLTDKINAQEGLYTLYLRGVEDGSAQVRKRVISSVSRCIDPYKCFDLYLENSHNPELRFIVSNTTEAGIVFDDTCRLDDKPASSFPGKLTQLLFERYKHFGGDVDKGFIILPCELIDLNGDKLKKCVLQYSDLWNLPDKFTVWIESSNTFCNTLVDRITTGYPAKEAESLNLENGYIDNLYNTAELFGFWVIEAEQRVSDELKFKNSNLPILVCDNHKPYKKRKVRILNGAHTSIVLAAYLMGYDIVRDFMEDETLSSFLSQELNNEVIPTIDLPTEELQSFANSVNERFKNPYIDHKLLDISLNSISKWQTRVMPSLLDYYNKYKKLPSHLLFSFSALLKFYSCNRIEENAIFAERGGVEYKVLDNMDILEFFVENSKKSVAEFAQKAASNTAFWGVDLSSIPNFTACVERNLNNINSFGMRKAMEIVVKGD